MTFIATRQCRLGMLMLEMVRAMVALITEYSYFANHERTIRLALMHFEVSELMMSRWPIFSMLSQLKGIRRHTMDLLGFTEEELIAFRNGGELVKPLVNEITNQEIAKNGYFLKEHETADDYPWTRVWRGDIEVTSGKIQNTNDGNSLGMDSNYFSEENNFNPNQVSPAFWYAKRIEDPNSLLTTSGVSSIHRNVLAVIQSNADLWPRRESFYLKYSEQRMNSESGEQEIVENERKIGFPSLGFAYVTMVYGKKFTRYLENFVRNFYKKLMRKNLLIFTLDDPDAYEECVRVTNLPDIMPPKTAQSPEMHRNFKRKNKKQRYNKYENQMIPSDSCIPGGQRGILQKFLIPWVLNVHNIDSVWIDFDVFIFQDPTPYLLAHQDSNDFEILISGSFGTHCICNGIVYFRATETVRVWLLDVIHWMYSHPYEHDQKCFAGWLDWTEKITPYGAAWALPRSGPIPRWDILDPIRQFITAAVVEGNGWMSIDHSDVVMFHFLAGDSDKGGDYDISGNYLKASAHYIKAHGIEIPDNETTTEYYDRTGLWFSTEAEQEKTLLEITSHQINLGWEYSFQVNIAI